MPYELPFNDSTASHTNTKKLICKDSLQISNQNHCLPSDSLFKKTSTQTTLDPNLDQIRLSKKTQIFSFITLGLVCADSGKQNKQKKPKKQGPCGRKSRQS